MDVECCRSGTFRFERIPLPPWANIRAFCFFFFLLLILEIWWIFQKISKTFEFTLGKNKKSHVFPIFLAKQQQRKHWLGSDEKLNWPVCYMAAAFSQEPTYWIVEVQVQIPNDSRSCKWQTLVLTCLCVQSLSKKLGSFLCLRTHPLEPRKCLKSSLSYANFFFKIILTKTDSLKIKFRSWKFLCGKIHTRISFSEFCIIESVASIQREKEHSMATWIVFTISCVLLFLTFFSWPIQKLGVKSRNLLNFFCKWIFFLRIILLQYPPFSF